ncbi:MAG: AgmX/PglI C-terminal domain-containing protein [Nitrosomonadales bacterium]|nr:AgmX/PglI C-terminal domain-containing protein [Nitrosomonadales bacterium]
MTSPVSPEQQALLDVIAEAKKSLQALQDKLDAIDHQVNNLAQQRQQFQLLENISKALGELEELGGGNLFWGMLADKMARSRQLQQVEEAIGGFRQQLAEIEKLKEPLYHEFRQQEGIIGDLYEDLAELKEKEESAKHDYPITRKARQLPYRPMVMPWSRHGEDDSRFRKTLGLVFLLVLCFNTLITFWKLPAPDENEVVEIPENLVRLVKKETPQPLPPENRPEEKPRETESKASGSGPKAPGTAEARKKAEGSGVLAFKESFSDLLGGDSGAKLGSAARISTQGGKASGNSNRNLVIAQAGSGSSGINTSGLSRQVGDGSGSGSGGGGRLGGVGFSRVTSNIGSGGGGGGGGDGRPLSDGPGPSRTDEEIQIVFDRYKATLYRIYNRELRKNPLLKGKMMLRLSIKPDGSVSLCKLESTDMDAPELVKEVLSRVERFNFGAKAGVPTTTILYPIDFLPAT